MKTLAEGGERRRRWRFVHVGYRMFYMNIHPSTCGFALRQNDDIVSYKKLHVTALCPVLWYFLVTSSATPLQSLAVAASSNLILGIKERQRRRANHFKNIFERKCRECNNASQTKWLQGSDTPTAPLPEKQARASEREQRVHRVEDVWLSTPLFNIINTFKVVVPVLVPVSILPKLGVCLRLEH